ncbi:hypothetical protein BVG16_26685 [Paenibacillus selenitireducens]|uniref:Uncharacterized protein n=1 Tax=Paenibacillus selenitireducens TaxID=1324314 RepID=A0A1T2X1I7_9BACL|nr:hypothetical protein [Paenibacillus selenitireducens]OPA73685.1 hypothetical protein BVG16_26685 [Paenibacillus selenitireducens]
MMIIKDIKELEGSCYIEVLPGKYLDKCWNDNSIFFNEEDFAFLETSIEKEFEDYDHYAFNEIPKEVWIKILTRLDKVILLLEQQPGMELLRTYIGFFYRCSEEDFIKEYDDNLVSLCELITEFKTWINAKLTENDFISILGI